ncbi:hypothetical protein [Bradyrhizobium sp. 170]|uniref:hypothetical protein n=1 Tax=Bradyrhizobium sp. 170 TaxID=2782641 RepID=UPI001FFE5D9E|nr:hypothetical protein [Bradyrhizobium sp. 170]UPK02354.1 hypothetical protein IVB05_32905 [Bradyrhizobium sp. 170]
MPNLIMQIASAESHIEGQDFHSATGYSNGLPAGGRNDIEFAPMAQRSARTHFESRFESPLGFD